MRARVERVDVLGWNKSLVSVNVTRLTTKNFSSFFLSIQNNVYLRNMLVVCGIPSLKNPARYRPTQLFIDSQGFMGVDDFTMLRIKYVPHMIKYHNLVPNQ